MVPDVEQVLYSAVLGYVVDVRVVHDWCQVRPRQCFNRGGAAFPVLRQPSTFLLWRRGDIPVTVHCCEHAATSSSSFQCAKCGENRSFSTFAIFGLIQDVR